MPAIVNNILPARGHEPSPTNCGTLSFQGLKPFPGLKPSPANYGTLPSQGHKRALRILARSMVRELDSSGYKIRDIAVLASELIGFGVEMSRSHRVLALR